jgi:hypothetical protein
MRPSFLEETRVGKFFRIEHVCEFIISESLISISVKSLEDKGSVFKSNENSKFLESIL